MLDISQTSRQLMRLLRDYRTILMVPGATVRYVKCFVCVLALLSQSMLLSAAEQDVGPDVSDGHSIHYMDYLRMVLEANADIQQQRLNWGVASTAVGAAAAEFDPVLSLDIATNDDSNPRTVTANELINRAANQQQAIDHVDSHGGLLMEKIPTGTDDVSLSISKKVKTGATLGVSVTAQKNYYYNSESPTRPNGEYVAYTGISFTQPLWQGRGQEVTYAQWRVTEQARAAAYQDWRQQVADTLLSAGSAYWDLYLAQQQLSIRQASLNISRDLLADQQLLLTHGASSRTDVVDGEVGVAIRVSDLAKAQQQHGMAARAMRTMAMLGLDAAEMHVADNPRVQPLQWVTADRIAQAYKQSPTYLKQQILLAQEEERLVYAADQLKPQLDLKGSYGFNGLGSNYGHSFGMIQEHGYAKWSVGVSLSAPLGKDKKAHSEYHAAQLRKMHALQKLQTTAIELEDAIYTAGEQIARDWEQIVALRQAVANTAQQFQVAQQQLAAGAGTVRLVLERESEHNRLGEMLLTAVISYQKSILALSSLDGTLLLDLQLESGSDEYALYMPDTTFGLQQ